MQIDSSIQLPDLTSISIDRLPRDVVALANLIWPPWQMEVPTSPRRLEALRLACIIFANGFRKVN